MLHVDHVEKKLGRGGIRTPGRITPPSVFKTDAFGHSATLPNLTYHAFAIIGYGNYSTQFTPIKSSEFL